MAEVQTNISENDILRSSPELLRELLRDHTTGKNIFWATHDYEELGAEYSYHSPILPELITGERGVVIRPRVLKSKEAQTGRSKEMAEVFTPSWICNAQNNLVDEALLSPQDGKDWKDYVRTTCLEITCGEAPYLVSRYDATTGEAIPIDRRVGLIDRKLRMVSEHVDDSDEWQEWAQVAYRNTYGYEWQGDNLLIARDNLLLTFMDYYEERWERRPEDKLLEQVANKIVWNIWQMDGLKDTVPLGKPYEEFKQMTLFDMLGVEDESEDVPEAVPCRIFNWRSNASLKFMDIREM